MTARERGEPLADTDSACLEFEWVPSAHLLVAYHANGSVDDDTWDEYVYAVHTNLGPDLRCLVWNEGGRPTTDQQRRLVSATQDAKVPVAIVSSSIAVRFIVSALALVNRHVRYFPVDQVNNALAYLCKDASQRGAAVDALERIRKRATLRE